MLKDIIKQYFAPRVRETFNPTKFSPRESGSPSNSSRDLVGRVEGGGGGGREKCGDSARSGNH